MLFSAERALAACTSESFFLDMRGVTAGIPRAGEQCGSSLGLHLVYDAANILPEVIDVGHLFPA